MAPLASTAVETATITARGSIGPRSVSTRTRAALRDRGDAGAESHGQACAEPGDEGAVASGQPPVGSGRGIVVGEEVPHREPVDLNAVHEAAQRVDEGPSGGAGCHRVAGAVARGWVAPETPAKGLVCAPGLLAGGLRGPEAAQLPSPGGVAPVDLDALGGGQRG